MKRFVSVLLVLLLMSGIGLEVFATSDEHVHTPGNWETLQEPTSEADGIQQTTCTTCNMVYRSRCTSGMRITPSTWNPPMRRTVPNPFTARSATPFRKKAASAFRL